MTRCRGPAGARPARPASASPNVSDRCDEELSRRRQPRHRGNDGARIAQAGHPKDESERVAAMPLILKNKTDRFAFQSGAKSALRSTSELGRSASGSIKEQASAASLQPCQERELAIALRELAELRLKLARIEAFAIAPSPSPSLH